MSTEHNGGNAIPEITREEHAGDINAKRSVIVETIPTHITKTNPSLSLTYTAGDLTKIEKTIGAVTYEKTLTWTDGVLTAVSSWSVV